MKTFGQLSQAEQTALREAHEAGRSLELFNDNIGEWMVTYRPTFTPDLAYRVAAVDSTPTDIKRG